MASKVFREMRKAISTIKVPFGRKKSKSLEELPATTMPKTYYQPATSQGKAVRVPKEKLGCFDFFGRIISKFPNVLH